MGFSYSGRCQFFIFRDAATGIRDPLSRGTVNLVQFYKVTLGLGLQYGRWVDTCSLDNLGTLRNSADLSEAMNFMYRYY